MENIQNKSEIKLRNYMHIFERRFQAESLNLAAVPVSLKFCVRQRLNDSVAMSAGHRCAQNF